LGAAGEEVGLDRMLKTNTSKKRTMSLFKQGLRWYDLMPNMYDEDLVLLMTAFGSRVESHPVLKLLTLLIEK
jgi:hypothetical protein